ncbi:hypothetical protein D3C87_1929090 [compost metagenome]
MANRRAFARRAHGHEAMRALGKLPFDKAGEGFLIHYPVEHGGDERRNRTSQHFVGIPQLAPGMAGLHMFRIVAEGAFGDAHHTFKFGLSQDDWRA